MELQVCQTRRRSKRILWAMFLILLLFLAVGGYVAIFGLGPVPVQHPPSVHPAPVTPHPGSYAGPYCYAGMPKPFPSFRTTITVLTNTGYLAGYCESRKDPVWVCYRLFTVPSLKAPPRPSGFTVDMRTRARVTQKDYMSSGYDRGHMAPNYAIAVCYGSDAQLQTFLMSNILPQTPALNRRLWQRLERIEISDYAQRFGQVWVIDGPVFGPESKHLNSGVAVQTACFKIILTEEQGTPRLLAFIIPQDVKGDESPSTFLTTVAGIERETGLNFFSELPDDMESRVEGEKAARMW